jgi:predicted AlkP superfamily pyrophosphatase or phosphodiesterase
MQRTAVINVVGLTESLVGEHTPRIREFAQRGAITRVAPVFPAVTCTAQSTYLTGLPPSLHGIVGNGWYHRELAEVQFWKQSNHLVHGRKLWDDLRELEPGSPPVTHHGSRAPFTCAKLFWWFNMYSTADYSITPRPMYPADGRKVFDIYTRPDGVRTEIKKDLGEFPFATFWGPGAGRKTAQGAPDAASRWIAESAKWIERKHQPTLSLIYLPHLDYNLQRHGPFVDGEAGNVNRADSSPVSVNPAIAPDLRAIDAIVGDLIEFFRGQSVQVMLLSEYGITNVDTPVHLNRLFRERGWLAIREELGLEMLDCGASKVFAVADHQVAHVYVNDSRVGNQARALLESTPGVDKVFGTTGKATLGVNHPRAGDLVVVAAPKAWFTYYYWLDDARAPDFARTVDIHRKPGYDPVELFIDPQLGFARLKIARRLLQKKLGFRMLMDVIPLDATLVKGSHGRRPELESDYPVLISSQGEGAALIQATEVYTTLRRRILG